MIIYYLSGLLVNVFQIFALLLPEPYKTKHCQNFANMWWMIYPFIFEMMYNMPVRFTGDMLSDSENAVIIGNHGAGLDFVSGVLVAHRGIKAGGMLLIVKESLKYLPGLGTTLWFQGCLFLSRNWATDQAKFSQKMNQLKQEGAWPQPFWIGIYPEGTRITAKKRAESHKFARERGLPILEHVLLPRTKGFITIRNQLPSSVKYVYNVTIGYTQSAPFITDPLLRGGFRCKGINVHVQRIPIAQVPIEEASLSAWLMDVFRQKDTLLAHLAIHNTFPASCGAHIKAHDLSPFWPAACYFTFSFFICTLLCGVVGSPNLAVLGYGLHFYTFIRFYFINSASLIEV